MVKYTLLNDKTNNIFASKYTTYLPTEEQLTKYIIEQREIFEMEVSYMRDNEDNDNCCDNNNKNNVNKK